MSNPVEALKTTARTQVERSRADIIHLSHQIHGKPELGFEEYQACRWLTEALSASGFSVQTGVGDLETAFTATFGNGPLHIGVCAEYDALPGIGHACGHNIIAAAAVAAGTGLSAVADAIDATVRVIGCPAEENGGGKVLLLQRGVFDGVHAAMMIHPSPEEDPAPRTLAESDIGIEYTGRAAHASAYPERGINAADALSIAQVAVAMLRQHIEPVERVHGITISAGDAPNVIPASSSAAYFLRAETAATLAALKPRVLRCFEAGALATGAEVAIRDLCPQYADFTPDADLVGLFRANAATAGRPAPTVRKGRGSTDMGNISQAVPAIHPMLAIDCAGSSNHQPEFAAHCASPSADRAAIEGGLGMTWTVIDAALNADVRARLMRGERTPTNS
jgi:amidohydrolase